MNDYQILKFASLFHDIGKFYQRADNLGRGKHSYDDKYKDADYGQNGAHSKWSADFLSDNFDKQVENLALHHHNPKSSNNKQLAQMLQKADHHSSKERIESEENQDVLDAPLTSIFSKISLDTKSEEYYIPLTELDLNKSLYPQDKKIKKGWNLVPEYKTLWNNFIKEFNLIKNKNFETVLAILKKYTSTIPSAAYKSKSDISLYDHLKTTTAIANCRYLYSQEEKLKQTDTQQVYKIITGDISGIQNFIYKVNTPEDAQSGMSKRLRGRSLYITLLCEAISSKIIIDLNLDSSNILFCGGGRFTIIAPNTSKTTEIIKNIDLAVNKFFINGFNSELYLSLASTEVCGNDLGDFGSVLTKLNSSLNKNKKHKFHNLLTEVFKIDENINYKICPVCGNNAQKEDYCDECNRHESLGSAAANAKYLLKYISTDELPKTNFFIDFLNIGYIFFSNKDQVAKFVNETSDINFTAYKLNDTNFLEMVDNIDNKNVSFDFKFLGNSIPHIKSKPLYFNHLAELSKGANKLGILKMDVDNLGEIFSRGFEHINGASISRISSLSFYMDLFFSGEINQIASKFKFFTQTYGHDELFRKIELTFENNERETIYRAIGDLPDDFKNLGKSTIHINYSGGDDLLVVGPYDDIISFAEEFKNSFKKWTAQNPSINISAGISIVSPKFPIGKAALMADEELEKSKACGKNKITLFDEILKWDSNGREKGFDEIFEFAKELELNIAKGLSKSFVYSLLNIWNQSFTNRINISNEDEWGKDNLNRLSTKAYVPLFKYKLRLVKGKLRDNIDKKGIKYMPWIKTPVSWVSLRLR